MTGSCISWTTYLDTNINGGVGTGDRTAGHCLTRCISDAHCSGVDWTIFDPAGNCFVFGSNIGVKENKSGVAHMDIVRNVSCRGLCEQRVRRSLAPSSSLLHELAMIVGSRLCEGIYPCSRYQQVNSAWSPCGLRGCKNRAHSVS